MKGSVYDDFVFVGKGECPLINKWECLFLPTTTCPMPTIAPKWGGGGAHLVTFDHAGENASIVTDDDANIKKWSQMSDFTVHNGALSHPVQFSAMTKVHFGYLVRANHNFRRMIQVCTIVYTTVCTTHSYS